jgi:hypothetical protein
MTIPEAPEPSLPDDPDLPDTKKPASDEPAGSRVFTLLLGPPPSSKHVHSAFRGL